MRENGEGTPVDIPGAARAYDLAAAQGDDEAERLLARLRGRLDVDALIAGA